MRLFLSFLLLLAVFSCREDKEKALFTLRRNCGIVFENRITDDKLGNIFAFRNYYNGGGVAIGDINNDGLADVFLTSNMGSNKLFLNKGGFRFEDITGTAGFQQDSMWSTGVVFADINHDGWLDIYVCNSGHMNDGHRKNKLYINNKNNTFTERAAEYGLDISAYTTQVSFFDYDLDGDLDCFMIDNSPIPVNTLNNSNRRDLPDADWPVSQNLKGGGDHLYRNDNGHFREVSRETGIHGSLISFGLGVSVGDVNGDGYPDVFVSNDSYERDYLYINQRNGTFRDDLETWFAHTSFSSMGADIADINNDGKPEIFTTDMLPDEDFRLKTLGAFDNIDLYNAKEKAGFYHQFVKNCLQLNNGDNRFLEIGNYSGVSASDWSWGALMFDMDNDGFNDIFVCNGIKKDLTNLDFMDFFANQVDNGKHDEMDKILGKIPIHPMLHEAYRNGGDLHFSDVAESWGFTQASFANGAAYGDLDNDGDLDLIINNVDGPAFVYENNSRQLNRHHFIGIRLRGDSINPFAVGSTVKVFSAGRQYSKELYPSRGFQSSVDYKLIFGLDSVQRVDSVIVTFPKGEVLSLIKPQPDSVYTISDSGARLPAVVLRSAQPALFHAIPGPFDKHQEDNNIDFYYEHNAPKMLSREGPKAATGDLNGDGLTDLFVGGTVGHPGQVYLQDKMGNFTKSAQPGLAPFSDFEDEAVLLFDADADGDLDLFIGAGGNNTLPMSRQRQNRLFLNDGSGHFSIKADAFPGDTGVNVGTAVACDFNHDGYEDLFVGGRSVPREYGSTPSSFLFVNDGHGHFKDIAASKNPDIAHIGMVTSAVWADVSGDSAKELIIAGEWMAPRIFSFSKDHFQEVVSNLSGMKGWWESLAVCDVNGDGKEDLLLGNIGENFYLHPDSARPVKLWVSDFDKNGNTDNILTKTVAGKDMPVFLKRDLEFQMPVLKKQNLKHGNFAAKSIRELFPEALLKEAEVKTFSYCSSIVAINEGNGRFTVVRLPQEAQFSSVNAICPADLNHDGFTDLVLGGNEFGFLPQFGRLDASAGTVLMNDGKGHFRFISQSKAGLDVRGQTRDIARLSEKGNLRLLFLENDEYPVFYELTSSEKK